MATARERQVLIGTHACFDQLKSWSATPSTPATALSALPIWCTGAPTQDALKM